MASEFITECGRCGAAHVTVDCYLSIPVGLEYGGKHVLELGIVCRRCHKSSIQVVSQKEYGDPFAKICGGTNSLLDYNGALNDVVSFRRHSTLRDRAGRENPKHLPSDIDQVLSEANACLAADCFNAAGAMFRLTLDLATKQFLPEGDQPTMKVRRSLGLRLEWLFEKGHIPKDLEELAKCVQQDGNDGAHDGTLSKEDAEDLQDFAFELVRRLFTEPERVRLASERRDNRRRNGDQ